jgi:hypothetical protein
MPLSPVAMLILRRQASVSPVRVDQRRFHDYNADIALQCYEFVVCVPGAKRTAGQREHHPQPPGRSLPHWSWGPGHRRRDQLADGRRHSEVDSTARDRPIPTSRGQ